MEEEYVVARRLGPKLVALAHPRYGQQLWVMSVSRKPWSCTCCRGPISKGLDCWRPLTNLYNRMKRICPICLQALDVLRTTP